MKKFLFIFLITSTALAQGVRRDDIVLDANGHPVPGASLRVCSYPLTGSGPCTPLANIYSDFGLSVPFQPVANPITADQFGNTYFFVAAGIYQLEFSAPGLVTRVEDHVTLNSSTTIPTVTSLLFNYTVESFSPTPVFNLTTNNAWTLTLTGNVTSSSFSGSPQTGQLIYFNLCQDSTGGRTFVPPAGFITPPGFTFLNTTANTCTNSSWFYTGTQWILFSAYPLGSGTTSACNGSVNLVFDVTCYGAVGGARQVLDGIMTSGSNSLQSATANFTSADVGKTVYVQGALTGPLPLVTTVASFISSTNITLTASATRSTSSAQVMLGVDATSSVQAAVTAATQGTTAHGGQIYFPPGQYLVLGPVYDCFDTSSCTGVGGGIVAGSNVDKVQFGGAGFYATTVYAPGNNAHFVFDSTVSPSDPGNLAGPGVHDMSIIGGDQPNGYAIHAGDLTNMDFHNLYLQYFRGASGGLGNGGTGAAIWFDNRFHWSERLRVNNVSISPNCTSQTCTTIAFTKNGGTNSFAYAEFSGIHSDSGWISVSAGASIYHGFFQISGNDLNILVNGASWVNSKLFINAETVSSAGIKVENGAIMENTGTINYAGMAAPAILDTSKYTTLDAGLNDQACGNDSFGNYSTGETCIIAGSQINPADGVNGPGITAPAVFAMEADTMNSVGNGVFMFNTVNDGRAGIKILRGTKLSTAVYAMNLDPQGLVDAQTLAIHSTAIPTTSGYSNQNGSYMIGFTTYTGKRIITWPDANVHFEGANDAGGYVAYLAGATVNGNCASLNGTGTNVAFLQDSGAPCGGSGVHHIYMQYANCFNGLASSSWQGDTSGFATPNCVKDATHGTIKGVLSFADGNTVYHDFILPADFNAFNDAIIALTTTDTTNGHTIIYDAAVACRAVNGGFDDNPAYNATQNFTTITIGGGAISGQLYGTSIATLTSTGCAAGSVGTIILQRGTDTDTDTGVNLVRGLLLNYH